MGEIVDPRFPWIVIDRSSAAPVIRDTRSGAEAVVVTESAMWEFIADHSAATQGKGIGDRVHDVLSWVGFKRCLPCAKRQAMLNALGK